MNQSWLWHGHSQKTNTGGPGPSTAFGTSRSMNAIESRLHWSLPVRMAHIGSGTLQTRASFAGMRSHGRGLFESWP
ncbi:MAG: hypothetical protein U0930_02185 [Pirellulales bacterium]